MDFITKLFDTSDFPDRWHCGTWTSLHGWIHVISDTLTWAAYTAIPIVLGVLIMRRKDLFFPRIFWLFSAFILACGTVHLVEAIIFWFPIYRVSAIFKMCTAVVSCATVVALIRVMPSALELPGLAGINEELRKEVAAREAAEQRLKLVLDNMSEVVMFANTEGRFEFWNDAAKDLCGVPKNIPTEEWPIHYQTYDAENQSLVPEQELPLVRALGGESVHSSELVLRFPDTPDVVHLMCRADPVRGKDDELVGAVLTATDITSQREAERQRELHHQQIERVTELASAVAVLLDSPTTGFKDRLLRLAMEITGSQSGCIGLLQTDGSSKASTLRQVDGSFQHANQQLNAEVGTAIEKLFESGRYIDNQPHELPYANEPVARSLGVQVVRSDGVAGWIIVEDCESPYPESELDLLERIALIGGPVLLTREKLKIEAGQRELAEQKLRQRQHEMEHLARTSTLGELTTTLAHELNQPMTTIANLAVACSNGLERNAGDLQPVRLTLNRIKDQALRSGRILKTIHELIQPADEIEVRQIVEVGQLIEDVIELIRPDLEQAQVTVRTEHTQDVRAQINPIRIQQVLLNLVKNAVHATENSPNAAVTICCTAANGYVEVQVKDNGTGMAAPEKVFDSFYTTKSFGIGIGLKICRSIVEACGGRITAENGLEGGAVLTFTLPEYSPSDAGAAS